MLLDENQGPEEHSEASPNASSLPEDTKPEQEQNASTSESQSAEQISGDPSGSEEANSDKPESVEETDQPDLVQNEDIDATNKPEENATTKSSESESVEHSDSDHDEHHYEDEGELLEQIDVNSLNKSELIVFVASMTEDPKLNVIRDYLQSAKEKFDNILLEEKKEAVKKWVEGGGLEEDFKSGPDPDKTAFFKAYKKVNKIKHDIINERNKEKEENLKLKKELLQKMKDIIQNENDIPKAFHEFHAIQDKWREVGPVAGSEVRDLWMTYKLYVDKFYELIKINRELQKLDQNKNLEIKINFCEQMEDLLAEKDLHKVLMRMRSLQNRWRAIGPVPRDKNEEIWSRFRNAIERLNERHAKHQDELKERYARNLVKKNELCENAEAFASFKSDKHNQWQKKIKELLELQTEWKKVGPVEKEHNDAIWQRFRTACGSFFHNKNEFYQHRKQDQKAAIQSKTELCIQAEALQNSEDWKQTTMEFKKLQEKWKASGHIADKKSKGLWERFKAAGDVFFKRKSEHYAGFEQQQEENLKAKEELIAKIEGYKPGENASENIEHLKQFQREWTNIGMVPIKAKNAIQKKFRATIDKQFAALNIDEVEKEKIKFSQKVSSLKDAPDSSHKIKSERFHISKKLKALQSEVNVWENNIGFFSHSKNAQDMKKEFEQKIDKAKKQISILEEKLKLLKQV